MSAARALHSDHNKKLALLELAQRRAAARIIQKVVRARAAQRPANGRGAVAARTPDETAETAGPDLLTAAAAAAAPAAALPGEAAPASVPAGAQAMAGRRAMWRARAEAGEEAGGEAGEAEDGVSAEGASAENERGVSEASGATSGRGVGRGRGGGSGLIIGRGGGPVGRGAFGRGGGGPSAETLARWRRGAALARTFKPGVQWRPELANPDVFNFQANGGLPLLSQQVGRFTQPFH